MRSLAGALTVALAAGGPATADSAGPSAAHLLIVAGLGGEQKYRDAFHEWATAIAEAAAPSLRRERVVYLGEKPDRDPARIAGPSTREGLSRALAGFAERSQPGDTVVLVLIGHGSAQTGEARFNLPGPDLAAGDLARELERFRGRRIAVVAAASGLGDFARALAGEDRIVITATKGQERNETVFGKYFAEAYAKPGADADKDERVSLLEAFEYARRQVARFYEGDNRLQTEHALLEDDGDGVGSPQPGAAEGDGRLAARTFLTAGGGSAAVGADAEVRRIEERLAQLKARKASLAAEEYERQLEALLLELAEKTRAAREKTP